MFINYTTNGSMKEIGTQESNSNNRNSTDRKTSRDCRTRSTTEGKESRVQEKISDRRCESSTERIRESVRQCKGYLFQGERCKTYPKECWSALTSKSFSFFHYLPTILSSITIDDYIMYDKVQLVVQCYSNQSIDACMRGLGIT